MKALRLSISVLEFVLASLNVEIIHAQNSATKVLVRRVEKLSLMRLAVIAGKPSFNLLYLVVPILLHVGSTASGQNRVDIQEYHTIVTAMKKTAQNVLSLKENLVCAARRI